MEFVRLGPAFKERTRPDALEINGVNQHQPRKLIERVRINDLRDFMMSFVVHPGIDSGTRLFTVPEVVHWCDTRAVMRGHQVEEFLSERVLDLWPQGIGDDQLGGVLALGCLQSSIKLGEGTVNVAFQPIHMQDGLQLARRFPTSTGGRHGQRGRNTEWRKDGISAWYRRLGMKVEREGGDAFDQTWDIRFVSCCGLTSRRA